MGSCTVSYGGLKGGAPSEQNTLSELLIRIDARITELEKRVHDDDEERRNLVALCSELVVTLTSYLKSHSPGEP